MKTTKFWIGRENDYFAEYPLSEKVFMHSGHSCKNVERHQFIPVHSIVREIGRPVAKCLPAVYALTGCDTTNYHSFLLQRMTLFDEIKTLKI